MQTYVNFSKDPLLRFKFEAGSKLFFFTKKHFLKQGWKSSNQTYRDSRAISPPRKNHIRSLLRSTYSRNLSYADEIKSAPEDLSEPKRDIKSSWLQRNMPFLRNNRKSEDSEATKTDSDTETEDQSVVKNLKQPLSKQNSGSRRRKNKGNYPRRNSKPQIPVRRGLN